MKPRSYLIIPLIAILFIGLVFTSGCVKKSEEKEAPTKMFVGGSKGLVLSFLAGAPPDEVFENSSFSIGVKLNNQGEYTIPASKANVTLGGISTTLYKITNASRTNQANLTGRQLIGGEKIPGAFEILTYNATAPDYPGNTEVTLAASVCYPYESLGVITACIKENLFTQTTGAPEICKVSGDKTVYNRGAPVQVSSVKEVPYKDKIGFNVKIKNKGSGYVYGENSNCSKNGNYVSVSASLSNIDVTCNPSEVLLTDGTGSTFCSADISGVSGDYEDLLQITLKYDYRDRITKKIKILNTNPQY